MLAVKKIVRFLTLFGVGSVLALTGCGGGADATGEAIYIHVLNAYPGSSKLTLYGPTGKVASGLPFGQRTEEPVLVDRNTNSEEFLLLLDGAPTTIEFQKQLFALYPQETATMVITRRSSEVGAEVSLFRNTRTFSPNCVVSFANSLALNNSFMPEELLSYSFQTEWFIEDQTEYVAADETEAETRCGPTAIPQEDIDIRKAVIDGVNNDPWFFPVQGISDSDTYEMRWAVRINNPRNPSELISWGLGVGGSIDGMRSTKEYLECMSAAVSVVQEEEETDPSDSTEAEQCPDPLGGPAKEDGKVLLHRDQVVWDELAVAECHSDVQYSGFPVTPGSEQGQQAFEQHPREVDGELVCGYPVRIRTPIQDLIFQNRDADVPNYVDNLGGFVQVNLNYPISEHHYFVLFGRPVNPFVSQWNTAADAHRPDNGAEYAYPGDIVPSY